MEVRSKHVRVQGDNANLEQIREKIIVPYAKLSTQEKKIIDVITKRKKVDASTLSEVVGMSRSNASLKLNKLYSWNFLNKSIDGKTVLYSIKAKTKTSKRKS